MGEKKNVVYTRMETDTEIQLTYNTTYIYLVYGMLVLTMLSWLWNLGHIGDYLLLVDILICLPYIKVHNEIRKASKKGSVQSTGNRYSFKEPLIITINKKK